MMDYSVDKKIFWVFRIGLAAWLFGWFFKYRFLARHFGHDAFVYPFFHDQFPAFFQSSAVSYMAFYLPLIGLCMFVRESQAMAKGVSLLLIGCAAVLGLHINGYNDMTYISSFWTALWLAWYAFHLNDPEHLRRHAPFLAQCVVGLLFLGGTVGKLTPEYWDGEAFHQLVVLNTPGFVGQWLLVNASFEQQKLFMGLSSKAIIILEALLALAPLYPYRFFCAFGVFTVVMLVLFRSWQILSVLSCLAGMMLACLLLLDRADKQSVKIK